MVRTTLAITLTDKYYRDVKLKVYMGDQQIMDMA